MTSRRYELSDFEWSIIEPLLPNKPRGVPRVEDRRVLNGIYWRLRTGSPWADIPERYGPATTCYNRFVRWRRQGVWDRLFAAVAAAYDGEVQMIDSSSIRVHQHGANSKTYGPPRRQAVCDFRSDAVCINVSGLSVRCRWPRWRSARPGPHKGAGTVMIFVCGRAIEHYAAMALMKRSPKMTANWALAMDHSRGGIFHSFSDRFKIR